MPLHDYQCSVCKREITVLRRINEEKILPDAEEVKEKAPENDMECAHDWVKKFGKGVTVQLWPHSHGPGKGRW